MERSTNVLAELAAYLKAMPCDSPNDEDYLDKAALIIEELAKVGSVPMKFARESMACIERCRAIAEEGAAGK